VQLGFFVTQKTLERLEWNRILEKLREHARTPGAQDRCSEAGPEGSPESSTLFESTLHGVMERLVETSEARAILVAGGMPPLSGTVHLDSVLARARKGGVLSAREILDVASTLSVVRSTRRFFESRLETAPQLGDLADILMEHQELESQIESCLEPSGEVRDSASPALAAARRDTRRLSAEIQTRVEGYLRDTKITTHLSDNYFTIRNDRYVLPVRADARGSIRGIVHDASNTGQTLFIEPEALVQANNQIKQAEIAIQQETLRILRRLSRQTASAAEAIESNITLLEQIDLAFARAGLAEELEATAPEVSDEGIVNLLQLRHPLVEPDQVVPSDVRLGESFTSLILSGPNAGGKTVALKAIGLAVLFVRAGMHVPADKGSRVDLFDEVLAQIGDEQDIRENLSTFSAHMANLAKITHRCSAHSLVLLDEIGIGTDPGEGAALAQAILETLAERGARVVVTTHYNLLKEMAEVDERFANASVEFDPDTLMPTYRVRMGLPGVSSATSVAARMGLAARVIDRANELLDREDRQLDRVLSELAASRSALETEQREIAQVRLETEAVRTEHREKLQKLQDRRDKLFLSMKEELETSFKDAHEQIATVIRELQRGGKAPDAAQARQQLMQLEENAAAVQREAGLDAADDNTLNPINWSRAAAGDPVKIQGGGAGVLASLPDRRGRVTVQSGSARVTLPMQRVGAPTAPKLEKSSQRKPAPHVTVTRNRDRDDSDLDAATFSTDTDRIDLHGLRVDEALDRLVYALDRAASAGHATLAINHGRGTGALRRAVREHLRDCPFVSGFTSASQEEGGEGITIATLR
jgi:DNA mismatch repair protein MutS2